MESLVANNLDADEVHLINNTISQLTPELSLHPILENMFLQENNSLTKLPPSFFEHIPVLKILDLSRTSIQSLPPSISKLCLLEEFILRECSLLMEVPPGIGALKNLKLFDLDGTEVMYLPKEIGKLETLECLRVSLSTFADDYKDRNGIEHIIPRMTISKLTKLKELSISVNPEAKWWEIEVWEAIMHDLLVLPDLKTLKLYLPTTKVLQQFLRLERYQVPIFSSLWDFKFTIGQCEQLPFYLQLDIEENFLKLEKCVKYTNGEGCTDEISELIGKANALYLRRHWTIEKLSVFDIRNLKYCLLMECNEMQTLIHQEDIYKDKIKGTDHGEDAMLGSLQYLAIHFMKKLQRISMGPIGRKSLSCLRILALHTCPELTSIFVGCLLDNFESLAELIVEDCPKVKSLVTLEATSSNKGPFLPNLKRVSLLDLPELVSISSGVCIAPQLDTLLVFNCMRLDYLSVMELPRRTKAIKGEIEWWDALKYGKLAWNSVFVQFKRDGVLMDQLAEDTNSLQHFLELPVVPTHPGSSLQVDETSSRDHHLGCNYLYSKLIEDQEHVQHLQFETRKMSTQKIQNSNNGAQSHYAGAAFRMWEPPCPVSGKQHNEKVDSDFMTPSHKYASTKKKSSSINIAKWIQLVKGRLHTGIQVTSDVGYTPRKYLLNKSLNSIFPRKSSSISTIMSKYPVNVSKRIAVEALDDGYIWRKYGQKDIFGAKYPRKYYRCSTHNCKARKHVRRSDEDPCVFEVTYRGKHTCPRIVSTNSSSMASATTLASTITDSHFELATWPEVLEPKEKEFHQCPTCNAQKGIQKSDADPSILGIAYKGMCTCLSLSVTSDSTTATESALSITYSDDTSAATQSALRILKNSVSSSTAESTSTITDGSYGLDYMKSGSASIQRWKQQANTTTATESALSILDTYDSSTATQSALRILKNSVPSSTAESTSTITDGSYGLDHMKSGSVNIQRWKQQANEIHSSITFKPNHMVGSELVENSSRNLLSSTKTPPNAKQSPLPASKARKEKLGGKIAALQQLVSPFGKTDTASVLMETIEYIKFLHAQVIALATPYAKQGARTVGHQQQVPKQDLRSQGLCLVPISSTVPIANQIGVDFSSPTF